MPYKNSLLNRTGRFFKKLLSFPRSAETQSSEEFHQGMEKAMRKLMNEFTLDMPDEKMPHLIVWNVQYSSARLFAPEGERDGKNASYNRNIQAKAQSYAALVSTHISSIIKGKIEGYQTELDTIKNVKLDELKQKGTALADLYNKSKEYARRHPREFSILNFLLCIIFAVCAFAADIPLNVSMVGHMGIGSIQTQDEVTLMEVIEKRDWDLILFAMGVCALGFYIKHLYNEYFNNRPGSMTATFREQKLEHGGWMWQVWAGYWLKLVFHLLVLAVVIFTLYNLGSFRNEVLGTKHLGAAAAQEGLQVNDQSARSQSIFRINEYGRWSFLGLTILLPLISGIFLSMSISIFSNISRHWKLQWKSWRNERNLEKMIVRIPLLNKRIKSLQVSENTWSKPILKTLKDAVPDTDHVTNVAAHFVATYEQSYKFAFLELNREQDEFDIAKQLYKEQYYHLNHLSQN